MIASIVVSVALVAAFAVWRRNRRGADGSPGRRSPAAAAIGAVPVLIGWVTLLVLVDAGVGSLVSSSSDDRSGTAPTASQAAEGQILRDPRADAPAYADSPWAADYLAELERLRYEFKPYLATELPAFEGRYLNTSPGRRVSWEPPGADGGDALEVWFFGGSTMFGEGQRDEHTIPSEFARIAADEGLTVRPVNFGHQGWVLWQEMLKFEQEVAREGPPDLAIFYDGVNDYNLQVVYGGGQPLHDELARFEASVQDGAVPLPAGSVGESPSVWRTYRSTSLFDKLLDRAGSLALGRPAGATPSDPEDERLGERFVEIVADVSEAYGRSVERTQAVAAAAETPVRLFWQPVRGQGPDYGALARQVPDGVTDISDTFDDVTEPIFIDGGHTNEAGARIVAERLFAEVATDLAAIAERRAP